MDYIEEIIIIFAYIFYGTDFSFIAEKVQNLLVIYNTEHITMFLLNDTYNRLIEEVLKKLPRINNVKEPR